MPVTLEPYAPDRHDETRVAELILESDPEMNRLVYGSQPVEVIRKLLRIPESYFRPETLKCAMLDGQLAGVVVVYSTSKIQEIDKLAGQGFMKAMGLFAFARKFFLFLKMEKMLGGTIDDDGLYIHTLCVNSALRSAGIGSEIIRLLAEENEIMYLYVNAANEKAIRFYERNGFRRAHRGEMRHAGKAYAEYLMQRRGGDAQSPAHVNHPQVRGGC
jgi:ribosomal protein S18 acetylase RimI-like enzyme